MVAGVMGRGCDSGSWSFKHWRMRLNWRFPFATFRRVPANGTRSSIDSFLSSNWRGEPLQDYQTIVNLIAQTTTAKGLKVTCRLDRRKYPTGRKVSDEEMTRVNLKRNTFHGDWNYVIRPNS